jgi:hypothetical protein
MGKRTGNPRGRPRGSTSKTMVARKTKVAQLAEKVEGKLADSFKGDSHELLMLIYKDTSQPLPLRVDAAKVAIAYEKPKLAAVEHSGEMKFTHEQALAELEDAASLMNGHEQAH